MNNIFSEIYGAYFRAAAALLSRRGEPLSEQDVYKAVEKHGFRDSALFLPKKLIPQKDGSDWGLLRKTESGLEPVTQNPPPNILTGLQKSWLRAMLSDPRTALFLGDDELERLSEKLKDIRPLYRAEHFRFFDQYTDGDDFKSPEYRAVFKKVLTAAKKHESIRISYLSGHNNPMNMTVLPLKLEYSVKNDKFRAFCRTVINGNLRGGVTINIGRIRSAELTGQRFTRYAYDARSMKPTVFDRRAEKPVTVLVKPERNAPERFLLEFANYEKRTERDIETGSLTVKLYYDRADETELLIQLLSFGAAVEILAPKEFRAQAARRVKRQAELLNMGGTDT